MAAALGRSRSFLSRAVHPTSLVVRAYPVQEASSTFGDVIFPFLAVFFFPGAGNSQILGCEPPNWQARGGGGGAFFST